MALALIIQNLAGQRINFNLVLVIAGNKLYLVHQSPVVGIQLNTNLRQAVGADAGFVQGDFLRLFLADIGLIAGGADELQIGRPRGIGVQQKIQLVHRQGCQLLKAVPVALGKDGLDQLGSAGRDPIGLRQLPEQIRVAHGLAQDRPVKGLPLQHLVDFSGNPLLQQGAPGGIPVVHADQDRIAQLVEIAVLNHGADQRVDGDVQITAGEIQIAHDRLAILIQRNDPEHTFLFVDLDLNAGVHVQGHGGIYCVICPVAEKAEYYADDQAQAGREPCIAFDPRGFLLCSHHNYVSFLLLAVGKDSIP